MEECDGFSAAGRRGALSRPPRCGHFVPATVHGTGPAQVAGGTACVASPRVILDATGLTQAEAAKRLQARGPRVPPATSRSYGSIVRANVFTVFNLILLVFGVITLAFGEWQDALFLVHPRRELGHRHRPGDPREERARPARRARHADRARRPRRRAARAARSRTSSSTISSASGPATSSSPTARSPRRPAFGSTSRSSPARRSPLRTRAGDEVRSGSFAVEGDGAYVVTAVGAESYAERVAGEAREFRHPRSPLERSLNRLLLILVGVLVPLGDRARLRALGAQHAEGRGGVDGGRRRRHARPRGPDPARPA